MTLTLEIPDELVPVLVEEATQRGLSVTEYALQLLASRPSSADVPQTGADLVAYWQSTALIGTRPSITDAPAHARTLRAKAEKRITSDG